MRTSQRWLLIFCFVGGLLLASAPLLVSPPHARAATRDPLQWPYASTSIWNMPLGSNARYVDATIGSRGFGTDIDWFITTSASDPEVPMYMPATWGQGRCAGTTPQQQAQWHPEAAQPLHVPTNLIIPDAITSGGTYWTPNSSSAFLEPDGKTLMSFNVTARCQAGGPLYGNWFGVTDLYGDGIGGGHGGSGMSSIGGSIRTGELLNDQPLHHALKIDIWGNWMHYDSTSQGHRWPAPLSDAGAPQQYKGSNPALVMGSLLALPPDVTPESLGVTSAIGKKIFQALQNYGAYVVDDTGGDYNALCVEHNADDEFKNATGHTIAQDQGLSADFNKMIAVIKVIDNNGPNSIGGGGTPRAALAPDFGVPIAQPTAAPTQAPTVAATPTTQATVAPTATKAAATPTATSQSNHIRVVVGTQQALSGSSNGPISSSNASNSSRVPIRRTVLQPKGNPNGVPWVPLWLSGAFLVAGGGGWVGWQRRQRRGKEQAERSSTSRSAD